MKKKSLLVLTLGCFMSLVACGKSAEVNHVVDQPLPSDDPTSEVEIVFWHCLGQKKRNTIKTVAEAFNAQWAGKYRVKDLEKTAIAGDYDSLASSLTTYMRNDTVPAMTMGYPDFFSSLMSDRESRSAILRLDSWIDDEEYGYSEAEKNDFVDAYYREGTDYQHTGTWSMPMYKSTEIMYYNKSFFCGINDYNEKYFATKSDEVYTAWETKRDAADNVNDPEVLTRLAELKTWVHNNGGFTCEVPESWQEMLQLAKTIKDTWVANNLDSKLIPVAYDSDSNLMITQLAQRGFGYTTNENINNPADHFIFNNADTDGLVSELIDAINNNYLTTKGVSGSYSSTRFGEGSIVMSIGSTGGSTYNTSSSFYVGVAPVPVWRDGNGNLVKKYIQQGPSICFFDNQNPYINKGAWLFYKALADATNNAKVALENSYDPVRKSSTAEGSWYEQQVLAYANKNKGLNYDIPGVINGLKSNFMTSPVFRGSQNAREKIGGILSDVISGYGIRESVQAAWRACW